ncbi:dihydrodipicolinate synthase family protein [Rhodotorula paludigena]|uniref:dihydrodipicolinate synthase family protein n=1 Tax=Rhodotorula paludigena TaxID=86838 RepID=UPI00317933C3
MPSKFRRAVPHGVYAPLYTFFNDDESLDLESYKKHVRFVASAGVGIVALGSSGEAVHLTRDERNVLISATREVLDGDSALAGIPLIVGTSASSTRETIEFAKDAARLGADFGMVISPGYFAGALTREAIKQFYVDVAEASPIPILVYNYPGAAAGIDINSDLMTEIASASTNIVGTKLTCGAVGKLSRITTLRDDFAVFGGFVDFLAPSLVVKSAGCITGLANIAPKTCLKLYRDTESAFSSPSISSSTLSAIQELQFVASRADWVIIKGGINGPKYALDKLNGYGGKPRRPLLPMSEADGEKMLSELQEVLAVERTL